MVYLRFMPCFQFFLVLLCHLLILGPDFCHDLSQILAFRSVDIHVDSRLGDLVTKLDNFLKKKRKSIESHSYCLPYLTTSRSIEYFLILFHSTALTES